MASSALAGVDERREVLVQHSDGCAATATFYHPNHWRDQNLSRSVVGKEKGEEPPCFPTAGEDVLALRSSLWRMRFSLVHAERLDDGREHFTGTRRTLKNAGGARLLSVIPQRFFMS